VDREPCITQTANLKLLDIRKIYRCWHKSEKIYVQLHLLAPNMKTLSIEHCSKFFGISCQNFLYWWKKNWYLCIQCRVSLVPNESPTACSLCLKIPWNFYHILPFVNKEKWTKSYEDIFIFQLPHFHILAVHIEECDPRHLKPDCAIITVHDVRAAILQLEDTTIVMQQLGKHKEGKNTQR
jgi:hypothetical protein